MANFFTMIGANLFAGNDAEGKFLTLEEIALPEPTMMTENYAPGGGKAEIQVSMDMLEALEAGFNLRGEDPDIWPHFGLGSGRSETYTVLGEIKNKRNGRSVQGKAVLEAQLGKIAGGSFKKGELRNYEYGLIEIFHYELYHDDRELFFWDLWTNALRVGGEDRNAITNSILQIG